MHKFQSFSRRKQYLFLGLMALLILLLLGGGFGLEQTVFADSHSLAVASPTTRVTRTVPSPTPKPSLTPRLLPTATPSPTPNPLPTVAPPATATSSSPILAVTPNNFYLKSCSLWGKATWTCTFTLSNFSNTSPLAWTAHAWNPDGVDATRGLYSTSGTLTPGGTTTASFTLIGDDGFCTVPSPTIYLQFTGPENSVTVTVICN